MMTHDENSPYLGLYLTVMANGPGSWTPEQVQQAYEFAKSLIPKGMEAQVLDFKTSNVKYDA